MSPTSSRILYDVPCKVCSDNSSGKHYGVYACDGCAGFFKRSVRRERNYLCKARVSGTCIIDKIHRNQCRFCRLAKCLEAGMNKDAVQHERGPRNSTIRRQMELSSKDTAPPLEPRYPRAIMPEPNLPPPTSPLSLFPIPFTHFGGFNVINHLPVIPHPMFILPLLPITNFHHGNDPEKQCEVAARLLFLNVRWIKSIISFESLSLPCKFLLLEESWIELFVLGVAQFIYPIDLNALQGRTRIDRSFVDVFESVLKEIVQLGPDVQEYTNLRSVILFKSDLLIGGRSTMGTQKRRLLDLRAVTAVKNRAQAEMNIHTVNSYPQEPYRASHMYRILRLLKSVSGHTIIELFFRNTIGNTTVEKIVTQMYQSETAPEINVVTV